MPKKPPSDKRTPKACTLWLSRTSSAGCPTQPIMRNKPNLPPRRHRPAPPLCKTNPITTRWPKASPGAPGNPISPGFGFLPRLCVCKNAKRTQSPPISSLPRWPKVSPDLSGNPISLPDYAKRTQFQNARCPTAPYSRETNPICPYGHGPGAPGCPYLAKPTQFQPPIYILQSTIYNPLVCPAKRLEGH